MEDQTKHKKLVLTISMAFLLLSIPLVFVLLKNREEVRMEDEAASAPSLIVSEPVPYTLESHPVPMPDYGNPPEPNHDDLVRISKEVYKGSKFEKISKCKTRYTNTYWPDFSFAYDNCKWDIEPTHSLNWGVSRLFMLQMVFDHKDKEDLFRIIFIKPWRTGWSGPFHSCYLTGIGHVPITDTVTRKFVSSYPVGGVQKLSFDYTTKVIYNKKEISKILDKEGIEISYREYPYEPMSYTIKDLEAQDVEYCTEIGPQFYTNFFAEEFSDFYEQFFPMEDPNIEVTFHISFDTADKKFIQDVDEIVKTLNY